MNFSELTAATAWIRTMDPDAEFTVERTREQHALWIVFSADAESIRDACRTCIDLQSDGAWIMWDDASDDQRASATLFRYILIAD
jgi:hypothetical protein